MKFYLLEGKGYDPHINLSIEEYLLDNLENDSCVFYLWQNAGTVVIGKNQEAEAECDLRAMKEDGITLARRCSGGGAVYHDLGNLNFSFIMPNEIYDVRKQLTVILEALKVCDINAEISGRNDLTVNGDKISGNAFISRKTHSLHHGTLLVATDFKALSKYLTPSVYKLNKKTISSVASRVINLSEVRNITITQLKSALSESFATVYKCRLEDYDGQPEIENYLKKQIDPDYLYGVDNIKSCVIEGIFAESYYKFGFNVEDRKIKDIVIYTDSLNDDSDILLDRLPGKGSEELFAVLRCCFNETEARRLSERFRELLLAKTPDIS